MIPDGPSFSVRHERVFSIQMPLERIFRDVSSGAVKLVVVPDHVFEEAALPERSTRCATQCVHASRDG
jgi:hypothetical protein